MMNDQVPRLTAIAADADRPFQLLAAWPDGRHDRVDMTGVLSRYTAFARLRADPAAFRQVTLVDDGAGIEWPGGEDFSAGALEIVAETQRPMSGAEFRDWLDANGLGPSEAAHVFDASVNTVKAWAAAEIVPRQVAQAVRAMRAEPLRLAALYRPMKPGRPARLPTMAEAG